MQITVITDTGSVRPPQFYSVEPGVLLLDWIIAHFGADGFEIPTRIFAGGLSDRFEIDTGDFDALNAEITGDIYIIQNPLGGIIEIGTFILAVFAVTALIPLPDIPEGARTPKNSPNNALTGQTNIARTLERVPEIFGQVISFPDLISPTAFEFIDHIKFQEEYMCIGRGFHDVQNFRSGNTLISQIAGSTVEIFQPGEVPTTVPKTVTSNEVASQTLVAPNEAGVSIDSAYDVTYTAVGDTADIDTPIANEWDQFAIGSTVIITDMHANTAGTDFNLDGTYIVANNVSDKLTLQAANTVNGNWTNFNGITENLLDVVSGVEVSPRVSKPSQQLVTGPFIVPGDDFSEVWIDIQAPQGLAAGKELEKTKVVDMEFLVEEIDEFDVPTGTSFIFPVTVADSTTDPRFFTFKITSVEGIVVGNRYQISGERITDVNTGRRNLEKVQWTRLASIEFIPGTDRPGTTRARIKTQATDQVASIQERKFNADVTRKVVTWDGTQVVGNIITGVGLVASRRFADCLLDYSLDPVLGARKESQIDIEALFAIQTELDAVFSGEKGEFNFTFDGKDTPALEEMRQIANATRCFLTRTGSFLSIIRDQSQPVSRGMFNRRNKKPDSETKSIRFNKPLDHDGILLEYIDREDNEAKTISLPADLPAGDPNFGLPPAINEKKIDGAGIRNYSQAWDRAQYELNRTIHQRITVESSVSAEGGLLPLNSRITHTDGTRLAGLSTGGEIRAVNGLSLTTSERTIFEVGKSYSVILRDDVGEPAAPISVTALPLSEFGFVLSSPAPFNIDIRGDNDYQRGTLYNFGEDGDELGDLYLLQRKEPDGDFYFRLELINYTEAYYQADDQIPPVRA